MRRRSWRMHQLGLTIAVASIIVLVSGCTVDPATRTEPPAADPPSFDPYGGLLSVTTAATGHFRTEQIDGVWWLVTPDGHGFFSAGVSHVDSSADYAPALGTAPYEDAILAKYGTREAWSDAVFARLQDWEFNTVGAWSEYEYFDSRMPFTPILNFSSLAPEIPDSTGTGFFSVFARPLRDYFAPSFVDGSVERAAEGIGELADNPYCIGVFTDNEIPWGLSAIQGMSYIDAYISLPAGAPGKIELQSFFEERYDNEIAAFNLVWGQGLTSFDQLQEITEFDRLILFGMILLETNKQKEDRIAFRERIATQYYSVVHNSIRAVDPEMLILGTRFVSIFTAPDVFEVAGPYMDVVSVNSYHFVKGAAPVMGLFFGGEGFFFSENPWDDLGRVYQFTGKPILITEYSYRAVVPDGPPSNHPPGYPTFTTQQERADYYSHYMNELYDLPYVVGAHWFEHCDQPATGRRGDGENNNFGVVNVEDDVYVELTDAMRAMNHAVRAREGP